MFFLALDFGFWKQPVALSWFNFPTWVFYFIELQIFLAITVTVFALTCWQSASDKERAK